MKSHPRYEDPQAVADPALGYRIYQYTGVSTGGCSGVGDGELYAKRRRRDGVALAWKACS